MPVRLIQISDLHLGRSFGGLGLPPTVVAELREASLAALRRACELVQEREAAALLVAGDLFDRPEVDESLIKQVRPLLERVGRPVLVSPGNHDAYGPMSIWNNHALPKLGMSPWPENVHIFATRELSPRAIPEARLTVHGHRVEGYHAEAESPLRNVRLDAEAAHNVLLIHGALEGARYAARTTLPFTAQRLAEIGADYAAVGHYHGFRRIEHDGRLLGAYAGVPVPGEHGEDPHGGLLVVTLGGDGAEIEPVQVYPGRIARLVVRGEPPFESAEDLRQRCLSAAAGAGLGARDIVFIHLVGFSAVPIAMDAVEESLKDDFKAVVPVDDTAPESPAIETPDGARVTVESQFVADLNRRIAACDDDEEKEVLAAALRYGRLALRGRAVHPPVLVEETEAEQ